ncbi:related to myo-inositol transporter [Cephalotrichum gorgonifer]|uniref:Related to myo-inositol transporter n=1 Tax=Cephalotrichum gorgonifer TaxID=2041049 RepID=A0AAE8SX00_9PEZI|nr:related to myo-inositol transporter [Cephalotrichum gorgonifer]
MFDDSQDAPLIARRDDESEVDVAGRGGNGYSEASAGKVAGGRPGAFVWALTASAGISGLLFGYDTGVISAALVSINSSLSGRPLTSLDKSIITSSTSLLALLASPLSSILADRYGRRRVILVADALFTFGALIQCASSTVPAMVAGRCVVGAGVGAASFVVPLYIAEVAPAPYRGMLVTTNVLLITAGQVVAYVIGWLFAEHGSPGTGWRWMVGLGAVPSVVQALLVMFMPETPRWLVMKGSVDEARRVVGRIFGRRGGGGEGEGVRAVADEGWWAELYGATVILASIILYVASYALGLGNVPWMQSELFPLPVRSLGSGVATATNWLANFAVGLTFLPLMDALGPARTFVLYALVCSVGYGLVWGWYPETAGLSLEEVGVLLEGW